MKKGFEASLYGHGSCAQSVILVGETEPGAIREYYARKTGAAVIAITKTSDGYQVEHSGRDIAHWRPAGKDIEKVYVDWFSGFREVELY